MFSEPRRTVNKIKGSTRCKTTQHIAVIVTGTAAGYSGQTGPTGIDAKVGCEVGGVCSIVRLVQRRLSCYARIAPMIIALPTDA